MGRARQKKKKGVRVGDRFDALATEHYTDAARVGSLGGLRPLARALRDRGGERTRKWARGFDAYNLHRPAIRKFKRRKTVVRGPFVQLQADLVDVGGHAKQNRGVTFLLTVVDAFSRRAWVAPLTSKRGEGVAAALESSVGGLGYESLQTDKGKEFHNSRVKDFLRRENIKLFSSENDDIKASLVERFNRTLRKKIHTYMTYRPGESFLDRLPDMVASYNATPHAATGVPPDLVDTVNAEDVYLRLYEGGGSGERERTPLLRPGDCVRISKTRRAFERGYTPNWTREVFAVRAIRSTNPVTYALRDLADEEVAGSFYERELQRVDEPTEFRIERVLRRRGGGSEREYFVKWLGYPESFNSWVLASDFV